MRSSIPLIGRAAAALALAASAVACSADTATAPDAPVVPALAAAPTAAVRHDVRLTTPNAGDGAALLVVAGAAIDSVTTPAGRAVLIPGERATRVVLSGALESGIVATLWTRAGSGEPSVALEQVTAADTHAQRDLAGYRVDVAR